MARLVTFARLLFVRLIFVRLVFVRLAVAFRLVTFVFAAAFLAGVETRWGFALFAAAIMAPGAGTVGAAVATSRLAPRRAPGAGTAWTSTAAASRFAN